MKLAIFSVALILLFSSCKKEEESPLLSVGEVQKQILDAGRNVTWGLNHMDADTLMSQIWNSEDALFVFNGRINKGYDNIEKGLTKAMASRKLFELKITDEFVEVFTPVSAVHVAEFQQEITDQNDSTFTENGTWTAFYRLIDENWKVVMVHESTYPIDTSKNSDN